MRARVVLILTILGLAMAVTAAPVAGGGGSLAIGNAGADGEVGGGFEAVAPPIWIGTPGCNSGFFQPLAGAPEEFRFALEFPLAGLPAGATITSATLELRMGDSVFGGFPAQNMYGYPGDGSITAADVMVTGPSFAFTPTTTANRETHIVTSLMSASVVTGGWAGFSIRQEPAAAQTLAPWDCPDSPEGGMYPILTLTYDLPNPPTPVSSNLPNAALPEPGASSPLATLGFGLLLIGALGVLVVANARGVARRR